MALTSPRPFRLSMAPASSFIKPKLRTFFSPLLSEMCAMEFSKLNLTSPGVSGGKMRVRTELLDFMIDSADTPQFEKSLPQEQLDSCRTWLTVNPMETEIEGKQLLVRYSIRVPEGTSEGSYHCAAGFTSQPPAGQTQAIGIQTAVRAVA